jgi:hypothetical protein
MNEIKALSYSIYDYFTYLDYPIHWIKGSIIRMAYYLTI